MWSVLTVAAEWSLLLGLEQLQNSGNDKLNSGSQDVVNIVKKKQKTQQQQQQQKRDCKRQKKAWKMMFNSTPRPGTFFPVCCLLPLW